MRANRSNSTANNNNNNNHDNKGSLALDPNVGLD